LYYSVGMGYIVHPMVNFTMANDVGVLKTKTP